MKKCVQLSGVIVPVIVIVFRGDSSSLKLPEDVCPDSCLLLRFGGREERKRERGGGGYDCFCKK